MNRSFPPYPPPPRRRMMHQMRDQNALVPAQTLMKLSGASERQSVMWREVALMTERRYGQLHVEAQDIVLNLGQENPQWAANTKECHDALIEGASMLKTVLDYLVQLEMHQQMNAKRWLHRMPPVRALPPPPVFMQSGAYDPYSQYAQPPYPPQQQYPQQPPPQGYPQQPPQGYPQQAPLQGAPQQPGQQGAPMQQQMPPPQAPLGDYRDPAILAEALKRAQPMPVGPQPVSYYGPQGMPTQGPVQQTNIQPIPQQQQQAAQQQQQQVAPQQQQQVPGANGAAGVPQS